VEVIKLFGDLAERGIFCDPGIGEYDVEPALVVLDRREDAVEIVEPLDVALQGSDVLADVLGGCGQLRLAAPGYEDKSPFSDKSLRCRQPDPTATAGDESNLAIELVHGPLLFRVLQVMRALTIGVYAHI
jgi:hypothetical protein